MYSGTKLTFLIITIILPIQFIILIFRKLNSDYLHEMENCIFKINLEKLKCILPDIGNISISDSTNLVNLLLKEDFLDYYNLLELEDFGLNKFIFTDHQLKMMCLVMCSYLIRLGELNEIEFEVVAEVGKNLHSLILSDLENHTLENLQLLNFDSNLYQNGMFVKYHYLDKFSTINLDRMSFINEQIDGNVHINSRTLDTTSSKILAGSMVGGSFLCGWYITSVIDFTIFDVLFA